jgi:hypothetical protein
MVVCDHRIHQLRDKMKEWTACLAGEDDNSIFNQLRRASWNIAAYRVLVEEVHRIAPNSEEGGKQLDPILFGLLHSCFSDSLLMTLRRLMGKEGLHGKRGVNSLPSLLGELSQNYHLLTRETIIAVGPDKCVDDSKDADAHSGSTWEKLRNYSIDHWTNVSEAQRSPRDCIPQAQFEKRCEALERGFEAAAQLINKGIAHAATLESRRGTVITPISFAELYSFHAELCKSAHFLNSLLRSSGTPSFLMELPDAAFKYLSRPIVSAADVPTLIERWNELAREHTTWGPEPQ